MRGRPGGASLFTHNLVGSANSQLRKAFPLALYSVHPPFMALTIPELSGIMYRSYAGSAAPRTHGGWEANIDVDAEAGMAVF